MRWCEIMKLYKGDLNRYGGGENNFDIFKIAFLGTNTSQQFTFWLRCCKSDNPFLRCVAKLLRVKLTRKYGLQIPETCKIGIGLELPHAMSIVVHYNAILGKNCTLHQFVTIGGDGYGNAPIIGDNCFISAGVVIVGNVMIGNNVTIGANAVVTKNIPDNATIGGVPAKVLHFNHPAKYIKNPVL